jgi:hypothetical protein
MGYDTKGRWVPDEDINWKRDTEAEKETLRAELTKAGLDWRHQGKYAFRTDIWGGTDDMQGLTEDQRFDVLEQYDTWYDKGGQLALNDEEWGLDIERGITYDDAKTWDTQAQFHNLTGGNIVRYTVGKDLKMKKEYEKDGQTITEYGEKGGGGVGIAGDKTGYDWGSLTNPYKYSDKVRGTLISEERADDGTHISTTYTVREYPLDWANYTNDELYRAAIDEVLEEDYDMFMGPGADYDNAKQVRAASKEIQGWVNEHYKKAHEEGKDGEWAEAEWEADKAKQIAQGRIYNARYPEGKNTRGFQHNQQVMIRKYKPFQKFDEETGTMSRYHPITGELRSEVTYQAPPPPTRMTITGNKAEENVDAGHYYSPTFGYEEQITDSMMKKPDPVAKPNISIRGLTARKPDNISGWQETGKTKGET